MKLEPLMRSAIVAGTIMLMGCVSEPLSDPNNPLFQELKRSAGDVSDAKLPPSAATSAIVLRHIPVGTTFDAAKATLRAAGFHWIEGQKQFSAVASLFGGDGNDKGASVNLVVAPDTAGVLIVRQVRAGLTVTTTDFLPR
jgi:hypothetical protein